jgi:hypothetical protein
MRTKTLLLTAAVGAAGVATSMAQVFSVNAVGYVNKTIPANGFAMVSNPLKAADNTIDKLFAGVPVGTTVYKYTPGTGYTIGTFDDLDNSFGAIGKTELLPGQGVFVKNPGATPLTITFVGEVMQGDVSQQMVAGLSMVSSKVPQAGTPTDLSFPTKAAQGLSAGDQVYKFQTNQTYLIATFDDLDDNWDKPLTFDVGEAVFVKLGKPVNWTRNFSVNTP